ncbi:MAG: DUF4190 domain-containing protein [Microbacteriaceae bacterium]|nr:DUF4190 domain-containing protein [Microbacteriaceae bacterium]
MSDFKAPGALPAADWYPDPGGSGQLRFWDGGAWTAHLRPTQAFAAAPSGYGAQPGHPPYQPGYAAYPPAYPAYGPAPVPVTNGMAVASFVLSLVGLVVAFVGPLLAIIFGHVALSQIKAKGEGGRGLAIAGLVIGYIGFVCIGFVVLAAIAIPVYLSTVENTKSQGAQQLVSTAVTEIAAYSAQHSGAYPEELSQLDPPIVSGADGFTVEYWSTGDTYCIHAWYGGPGDRDRVNTRPWAASDQTMRPVEGLCV